MTKNIFVDKIKENKDKYVIFYSDWCPSSIDAIDLFRQFNLPFKGYKIEKIKGSLKKLIKYLKKDKSIKFDPKHTTRPIIFKYGEFLGGYDDLVDYLNKQDSK